MIVNVSFIFLPLLLRLKYAFLAVLCVQFSLLLIIVIIVTLFLSHLNTHFIFYVHFPILDDYVVARMI